MAPIAIRAMHQSEGEQIAAIWYRSGKAAYPYLPGWQTMTPELARQVFADHIAAECRIFVAELDGVAGAYLAMNGSYVDRLYVDPPLQGQGLGNALLDHARSLSPDGLELHTHVENSQARAFYEARGFKAVRFGISPPPECAPDVEYHWRP